MLLLCLLVCESCVAKKDQGLLTRRVMLVLYVSAARRGPVGGLSLFLSDALPAFPRAGLSVFAGTQAQSKRVATVLARGSIVGNLAQS